MATMNYICEDGNAIPKPASQRLTRNILQKVPNGPLPNASSTATRATLTAAGWRTAEKEARPLPPLLLNDEWRESRDLHSIALSTFEEVFPPTYSQRRLKSPRKRDGNTTGAKAASPVQRANQRRRQFSRRISSTS